MKGAAQAGTPHFSPRRVLSALSRMFVGMYVHRNSRTRMLRFQSSRNMMSVS